ncbi:MAG: hypothetical protein AAFZ15_31270 [Bacteroidota bacterium]
MNPYEGNSLKPEVSGKTTCTFRIMPQEKLKLALKAKELGLSPSQYIEALVLSQHQLLLKQKEEKEVNRGINLPFQEERKVKTFYAFLNKLKKRFPKNTIDEIVLASMIHAYENQGALWQRSLKTFLRRLRNHFYNLK